MTTLFEGNTQNGGAYNITAQATKVTFRDGSTFSVNTSGLITDDPDDFHQYDSFVEIEYSATNFLSSSDYFGGPVMGAQAAQRAQAQAAWANQNVSSQHVFQGLLEEAAPDFFDDFGNPVTTGSRTLVTGMNPVTHIVDYDTMTVVNVTEPGHVFHDGILGTGPENEGGIVVRRVIVTADGTFVHSIGVGVGQNAVLNNLLGATTFDLNTRIAVMDNAYRHANSNNECFLYDTQIQMWPLDPSIKPRADGSYDEELVLSKVWHKRQDQMQVDDCVVSHDKLGRMQPGRVSRTMVNKSTHILDFWGTGVTPGHAYYCADGPFKDGYAPIMDILRSDTALRRSDGTTFRAATNCDVGSIGDRMIHAAATFQKPDGSWTDPKPGQIRFGTRISTPDGKSSTSVMDIAKIRDWKLSDDGYMVAMIKGEDGTLQEQKLLFPYTHGEVLPKPEDYILTRSQVTLEAIYAAGEWEEIGTQMPAPAGMEGLNTNHTSTLLKPSKPQPNIPPAFANRPDAPTVKMHKKVTA